MTVVLSCLRGLLAISFITVSAISQARAACLLEKDIYIIGPRYDGTITACEAALDVIALRFAQKEGRLWNSNLQILGFDRVRETAFRPWAQQTVPRRYCSAVAQVSDGRNHTVHYAIIEDGGMAGMFWGVEWCVVGLDRNCAYNPSCKMAQP